MAIRGRLEVYSTADLITTILAAITIEINRLRPALETAIRRAAAWVPVVELVQYSRMLGLLKERDILNYSKVTHLKLYKTATTPLMCTFDIDSPNVKFLFDELKARAKSYG